jgi:hypothetical protein
MLTSGATALLVVEDGQAVGRVSIELCGRLLAAEEPVSA